MKTARFSELVKKAGAPNPYLLWVSPKKDSVFQRAVKEQRVLTIHQENVGTKKDYGMVGFHEEPNAQYLIFPKSLKALGERRIIGINYDLLAKESRREPEEKIVAFEAPVKEPRHEEERSAKIISAEKSTKSPKRPKPPKPPKSPKSPREEKPRESAKPTQPEKPSGSEPAVDSRVLSVVRRAMKDLDAGKTVAAYKRLEALVAEAENEDD